MRAARVGLVNCGLSLMAPAWEKMEIAWEIDGRRSLMRRYAPHRPTPKGWDAAARAPTNLLGKYPVDVLINDRSGPAKQIRATEPDWYRWLTKTPATNLPRIILELSLPEHLVHHEEQQRDKGLRKRMAALGYCQRCALVRNTEEGGAVTIDMLVTTYTLLRSLPKGDSENYDPFAEALTLDASGPRAMSNLLRPCNIPRAAYQLPYTEKNRPAPDSGCDPMPARLGAAIQTKAGVRRLLPDELAKGLGIPTEWGKAEHYPGSLLNSLPGIHTWEAIGRVISPLFQENTEGSTSARDQQPESSAPSAHRPTAASPTHMDDRFTSEAGRFEWVKPDLSRGSSWHLARVYNLVDACKGLRDRKQHFLKGPANLAKPSVQLRARRYRIALTLVCM